MIITATHFNYYHVCHRKLWLFSNGIQMEHTSDAVYEGKLIHDYSYPQRSSKYIEIEIDGCKIDFYDIKSKVVHEIKKSNKIELAHKWQLKYYIYILGINGITGVSGMLEYPTLRIREKVFLEEDDKKDIERKKADILKIVQSKLPPKIINSQVCRRCSYYEFCYTSEVLQDMKK